MKHRSYYVILFLYFIGCMLLDNIITHGIVFNNIRFFFFLSRQNDSNFYETLD